IVRLLRQRSRPYLFSNSLAPPIVAASLAVLDLLESAGELRRRLRDNTARFRALLVDAGFDVLPGEHPIVPVMVGDAAVAGRLAEALLAKGIYVIAFSYPVVPKGAARIRTQVSAAHTSDELAPSASAGAVAARAVEAGVARDLRQGQAAFQAGLRQLEDGYRQQDPRLVRQAAGSFRASLGRFQDVARQTRWLDGAAGAPVPAAVRSRAATLAAVLDLGVHVDQAALVACQA